MRERLTQMCNFTDIRENVDVACMFYAKCDTDTAEKQTLLLYQLHSESQISHMELPATKLTQLGCAMLCSAQRHIYLAHYFGYISPLSAIIAKE